MQQRRTLRTQGVVADPVDRQRGYARIVVKFQGMYTDVASDLSHRGYVQNEWTTLGLHVRGDELTGFGDGAEVLRATDGRLTAGATGLYTWASQGVRFDDLTVTSTSS